MDLDALAKVKAQETEERAEFKRALEALDSGQRGANA